MVFRLIAAALLFGKIDNARRRIRPTVALRFAVIAKKDRKIGFEQVDRRNLVVPLLRREPSFRTQWTSRHRAADAAMRNALDGIPGNLGAHDNSPDEIVEGMLAPVSQRAKKYLKTNFTFTRVSQCKCAIY